MGCHRKSSYVFWPFRSANPVGWIGRDHCSHSPTLFESSKIMGCIYYGLYILWVVYSVHTDVRRIMTDLCTLRKQKNKKQKENNSPCISEGQDHR